MEKTKDFFNNDKVLARIMRDVQSVDYDYLGLSEDAQERIEAAYIADLIINGGN